MKSFFAFATPFTATWACALVVASCTSSIPPDGGRERTGSARSALTFLTREIDGTVAFSNSNPTVTGILAGAGNCGGNVGAQSTGASSPSPALTAGTTMFNVAPSHLSADYQVTVD